MRRLGTWVWPLAGAAGLAALVAGTVVAPRLATTSSIEAAGADARAEMLALLAAGRAQTYRAGYAADAPERRSRNEDLRIDVFRKPGLYRVDTAVRTGASTTLTSDIQGADGRVTSCTRSPNAAWSCSVVSARPGEDGLDSLLERVTRDSAGQQVVVESRTVGGRDARCFTVVDETAARTTLCLSGAGVPVSLVAGDTRITLQDLSQGVQDKDFVPPA